MPRELQIGTEEATKCCLLSQEKSNKSLVFFGAPVRLSFSLDGHAVVHPKQKNTPHATGQPHFRCSRTKGAAHADRRCGCQVTPRQRCKAAPDELQKVPSCAPVIKSSLVPGLRPPVTKWQFGGAGIAVNAKQVAIVSYRLQYSICILEMVAHGFHNCFFEKAKPQKDNIFRPNDANHEMRAKSC